MPVRVRYFYLSDAHFFVAKTTYRTVRYLQVPFGLPENNFLFYVL